MKYPYIRKIIYAIGAQPEPYNIDALEKLATKTNDEQIKDLALHQIKKRKELGRWEAAKNEPPLNAIPFIAAGLGSQPRTVFPQKWVLPNLGTTVQSWTVETKVASRCY